MFGIGFGEMVVIAVLILIAVGPDKLPTMIKTVARTYRQFRRAANDLRASTGIDDLLRDEELRELAELRKQKLMAMGAKGAATGAGAKKPVAAAPGAEVASSSGDGAAEPERGEDDAPIAPVAAVAAKHAKSGGGAGAGLTYKQRTIEAPLEGVDVFEARHQVESKTEIAIPETREAIDVGAKTELARKLGGSA